MTTRPRLFWLALALLGPGQGRIEGATLGSALRQAARAMADSPDEAARGASRVLGRLAGSGDEALEHAGRELADEAGGAAKTAAALDALRRLEPPGGTSSLPRQLDELGAAGRRSLAAIVRQSQRVAAAGLRRGIDPEDLARSLEKGGPDALVTVRAMRSDEGIAACLDGYRRYGGRFTDFARKGDEGAAKWLAAHADGLEPRQIDELLSNPARYLDAEGRLTRAGEALVQAGGRGRGPAPRVGADPGRRLGRWGRRGMTVAVVGGLLALPDRAIDAVRYVLGRTAAGLLSPLGWPLTVVLLAVLVWLALPWATWGLARAARSLAAWAAARPPGRLRELAARLPRPGPGPLVPAPSRGGRHAVLRLGFLGSRRVGKSTFIVMLNRKLPVLAEGASFEPLTERPDRELLDEIADEVSHCRPTRDEKRIRFRLVWPYRHGGAAGAAGHADNEVELTDFPGEWGAAAAAPADRQKLIDHLNRVDGLFVVLDPTELEARDGQERSGTQRESIDGLFREDGLDLGRRFLRTLAFVITKRDLLDRPTLERLAAVPDGPGPGGLERVCELASRPALTAEESAELGRWVLDAMLPGQRSKWEGLLASSHRYAKGRSRFLRLLRRSADPQVSVFAVSLLGPELGRLVLEHREAIAAWQAEGGRGPEPQVLLDFGRAATGSLDFHLPFRWMFDHLPEGLLHQANALTGVAGRRYRRSVHARFRGAPSVVADLRVGRRRIGVAVSAVLLAAFSFRPGLEWWQGDRDRGTVRAVFADAAGGDHDPATLSARLAKCRRLPTRPYGDELNAFEVMLRNRRELAGAKGRLDDTARTAGERLKGGVDWLNAYARLPKADERWPSGLKDCRRKFDHELKEVMGKTLDTGLEQALAARTRGDFESATTLISLVRSAIPGEAAVSDRGVAAAIPDAVRRLDDGLLATRDAGARARFMTLPDELEKLLAGKSPEYALALHTLSTFAAEKDGLPEDVLAGVGKQQDRVLDRFWWDTRVRADEAVERDDFGAVADLLRRFEVAPDLDERRKSLLREYREGLDRRRAAAKIKAARAHLARDPGRAITLLDEVRPYLPALRSRSPDDVRGWYETAVEARRDADRWADAVLLLRDPDVASEPWAKVGRAELWEKWAGQLRELVPRAGVEEARAGVSRFLNAAGPDTPPGLVAAVRGLNDGLAPRRVQEELRRAEEMSRTDASGALDALLALRADVPKVRVAASLTRWRDSVVELYCRLGRHPEALQFLMGLGADDRADATLAPTPGMVDDVWGRYARHREETFRARMGDGQAEEAWRGLWGASRESGASDAYLSEVRRFAQDRISERMSALKEKVADETRGKQFGPALALVAEARKELGEWSTEPRQANELAVREAEVAHAELSSEAATLETQLAGAMVNEQMRQIDLGIAGLLGRRRMEDGDRARLNDLRERSHTRWERLCYDEVRGALTDRNFESLGGRIETYLDPSAPFGEKRPAARKRAVQDLQAWLEGLARPREYVLTAVRVKDLPYPSKTENEWGGYDPYVSVTFAGGREPTVITSGAINKWGSFSFFRFHTNNRFTWRKGQPVELGLWDDRVEAKGRCMGRVRPGGPYALLRLALPGSEAGVDPEAYDYKGYAGFDRLRLGLDVSGLGPPPPLPE